MMTWIALLRGINVGGHRRVNMAELRALLSERGLKNVRTLIQSGNVAFESSHRNEAKVAAVVKEAIFGGFGHDVEVIMRTRQEIDDVVSSNPFVGESSDTLRLNIVFLAVMPTGAAVREVESIDGGPERVRVVGRELYWLRVPHYRESVYTQSLLDRHFGRNGHTTRNKDVVEGIAALARTPAS